MSHNKYDFIAACLIPTGIGASIGGFAGDASPYINLLSKVCPVMVNPNAVNAAIFSGVNENVLYTEGWAVDAFFRGDIALRPSKFNKIGVLFDVAIPQKVLNVHFNTINAVKSVYGMDIMGHEITDEPVGVEFFIAESGISTGRINNPDTLISATNRLIERGAEAIAIVCYFDTPENDDDYAKNGGVDPVGGVEAMISHLVTEKCLVPAAHAPAFSENELLISAEIVDKRAAAEYITPTFLPCLFYGLYNAPKLIRREHALLPDITVEQVGALIMPYDCLDSPPVYSALERGIPVLAVEENRTVLDATPEKLNISDKVIIVKNYQEAAGWVLALKNGICL